MKRFLLIGGSLLAVAAPAAAQSGPYVGVSGGILFPRSSNADVSADFTTTQTPGTPAAPGAAADVLLPDAIRIDYDNGYDVDGVIGYDFGFIRAEAEVAYKRAKLERYEFGSAELAQLSTALNRPSTAPDPFAPGFGALVTENVDGRVEVLSGMLNAFVDLGTDRFSIYGGGGVGRARVELLGNRDTDWATQLIAGARFAVSDSVDIGVKYRYFRTSRLDLGDAETTVVQGNPDLINVGTAASPVFVERRTSAALDTRFNDRFTSHSVLATLAFNFGRRARQPDVLPPPVIVAPPPPPPAPATQTCPDGSVVLATDVCPVPPGPPPPPEPAPVRG